MCIILYYYIITRSTLCTVHCKLYNIYNVMSWDKYRERGVVVVVVDIRHRERTRSRQRRKEAGRKVGS